MEEKIETVRNILKKYGQEEVLAHYDKLSASKQEELLNQVLLMNFEQINKIYLGALNKTQQEEKIEPISYTNPEDLTEDEKNRYIEEGEKVIKKGKLAAVTMAGGQGTRLGHNGPKGTYILDIRNNKSLFEILCDSLKKAQKKYNVIIPWYIMTSRDNNSETISFFENNDYFNYGKENIRFFMQSQLPMLNIDGKVLIGEEGLIKQAADGHGGIFTALIENGMLNDMRRRGIEWVFIGGVDNCLVKMVDPLIIGLSEKEHVLAAGKSLEKAYPKEKVGVFCKKAGKPTVIEYSEISDEMAERTDEKGKLVFGESHILCNMFNIKAIEQVGENKLPYHAALKKATYMNKNGEIIVPDSPNSYKFESFIFDVFERLDDMLIMRVKREEEFAPVKNAEGVDSPETARILYYNQQKIGQ